MKKYGLIFPMLCFATGLLLAQRWGGMRYDDDRDIRTARELPSDSTGTPEWTNAIGFERDVFTFARIHYSRVFYAMTH